MEKLETLYLQIFPSERVWLFPLNCTWSVQNPRHPLIPKNQPVVNKELQMMETLSYFLTSVIFLGPHQAIALR